MLSLQRTLSLGYLVQRPTRMVLIVVSIALGVATLVATRCLDDSLHQAAKGAVNPFATLADLLVVQRRRPASPPTSPTASRPPTWPVSADVEPLVMGRAALIDLNDQSVRLLGVKLFRRERSAPDAKRAPATTPGASKSTCRRSRTCPIAAGRGASARNPAVLGRGAGQALEACRTARPLPAAPRAGRRPEDGQSSGPSTSTGRPTCLEDESVFTDVYTAASIIYPQRSNYCTQLNLKLAPGARRAGAQGSAAVPQGPEGAGPGPDGRGQRGDDQRRHRGAGTRLLGRRLPGAAGRHVPRLQRPVGERGGAAPRHRHPALGRRPRAARSPGCSSARRRCWG